MTRITLSHQVYASPSEVFDIADNHENYPRFFQDFRKIRWTSARHQVGTVTRMEAKLGSAILSVAVRTTDVVPDSHISGEFVSGLEGKFDWDFSQEGETTWVTLSADYQIPPPVMLQPHDRGAMDHALCTSMQKALAAVKEMIDARKENAA